MFNSNLRFKIEFFLFAILGSFIVSYIIYVRLIMNRPIQILFHNVSLWKVIVFGWIFLIFFSISLYKIYNLYRLKYPSIKEPSYIILKIKKILSIFSSIYIKSLNSVDRIIKEFILERIFNLYIMDLFPPLKKIFNGYITPTQHYNYLVIFICIIPRYIILLVLMIEVFFFNQIKYFYLCGPIIIILLGFDYYMYTIDNESGACLARSGEIVQITHIPTMRVLNPVEYIAIKSTYMIPYKQTYILYKYGREYDSKDFGYSLTPEISKSLKVQDKKNYLLTGIYNINEMFGLTVMLTANYYSIKKRLSKFTHLSITVGYAITWGYVFFYSLYIYFT